MGQLRKRHHNDGVLKRCDCARRQWAKCPHPWHFSFHHGGKEHRYSLDVLARLRGVPAPRTKHEANTWRDALRGEIRGGADVGTAPAAPVTEARLTLGDVADVYAKRHINAPTRREAARDAMTWVLDLIRETEIPAAHGTTIRLEAKPLQAITQADVEAFRDARRAILVQASTALADAAALELRAAQTAEKATRRALRHQARALRCSAKCRPGVKGGEVGINRLLARLRHVFSWAIEQGYIADTPFKRGPVTVVRLETRAETARTRRLDVGDEDKLLTHASAHLRALVVAALSTGCRLGELLSLTWAQIRRDEHNRACWIGLSADRTKTNEARMIPVGTRLRAELEMRRHGPDGKEHAADAYVFGNDVGEQVASIKTAWRATCRRAGIRDLHFHDLRREFGSRLIESGADQHDVRDFLGHANITTTSRYLRSTPLRLERALATLEAGGSRTPFAQTARTADQSDEASPASDAPKELIQ